MVKARTEAKILMSLSQDVLRSSYWWNSLTKHVVFVLAYLCLFWLIHTAVISVVVFFHFSLGHNLNIIDIWIFDQAWKIIILTKVLAIIPVLKFAFLYTDDRKPISRLLKSKLLRPRRQVFVLSFFVLLMLYSIGDLYFVPDHSLDFFRVFWNFLGVFFFYSVDAFLFIVLLSVFPLKNREKVLSAIFFSASASLMYFLSVKYTNHLNISVFFSLLFVFFLTSWRQLNWLDPVIFICLVLFPVSFFYGLDPIWGGQYSLLSLVEPIPSFYFFLVYSLSSAYLIWSSRNLSLRVG